MKNGRMQWAARAVAAGALTLMTAAPMFAQSRNGEWRGDNRGRGSETQANRRDSNRDNGPSSSSYRENQRVTLQGQVSSFTHERNGYRVNLDRGQHSFWVPESYFGRGRTLRSGISIQLGGVFRSGTVYVDAVSWPGDGYGYGNGNGYGYDRGYVRGVVDRVDRRTGIVWLRDDASGRLLQADLRGAARYSRIDANDLRRGDYVELSGDWLRGGVFQVASVDSVRTGRY